MQHYLFLVLLFAYSFIHAQTDPDFTGLVGDYLGQIPPGDTPVVFAPDVISTNGLEHSAAVFSTNGDEVYWSAGKIMYMQRLGNRWTAPRALDLFKDSGRVEDQPFISPDGKKLYFNSAGRETSKEGLVPQQWSRYNNEDIWFVERESQTWSKPVNFNPVINTDFLEAQATFTNDGTIYFLGYLDGVDGECGIFRSVFKKGRYSTPEPLPEIINSKSQDWTPFIAPDESFLIFSSYRDGGYGQGDLYISFHDTDTGIWSEPVNMGKPVNSPTQERFPVLSPDGNYLFFTRWTADNNHDIYWVDARIIDNLRTKLQ